MQRKHIGARLLRSPWPGLALCMLLGLAAGHPLLIAGRLPAGSDAALHLERMIEFTAILRRGVLIPRWAPDLLGGYGFPVFNYYAPLAYWLPSLLSLAGLPYVSSMLFGLVAAMVLAAVGMYLWARDLLGEGPALVASAAYVFSPYLLFNLMTRVVLPELTALALLPLVLYSLRRAALTGRRRYVLLAALSTGALILAHNVTAIFFAPLAAAYAIMLLVQVRRAGASRKEMLRAAGRTFGALLGGILLAAYYWLPALAETHLVQFNRLTALDIFDYHVQFRTLREVFSYPLMANVDPIAPYYTYNLSWLAAGLAAVGVLYVLLAKRRSELAAHLALLLAAGAGALLMVTPASTALWEALPPMRLLQFPWRFTGIATLCLAWLSGLGALALGRLLPQKRFWQALAPAILVGALFCYGANWLYAPYWHEPWRSLGPADLSALELRFSSIGTTTTGEYLPAAVQELPPQALETAQDADRLDYASLPADAQVLQADWQPFRVRLRLSLPVQTRLVLRIFYFEGWHTAVDGAPTAVTPTAPYGLISLEVPAGEHEVTVAFGSTPVRSAGLALSLAALLTGALWALLARRRGSPARPEPVAPTDVPWLTYGLALAAITLSLGVKMVFVDPVLASYPSIKPPGELSVSYGGALELCGVRADASVPSGGQAHITLYWRVPNYVMTVYSTGILAVDERGVDALWEHIDHQRPGNIPTTWWYPGDVVRDAYTIQVPVGTPPGRYTLRVQVYPYSSPMTALDIQNPGKGAHGKGYDAAVIEVTRPKTRTDQADIPQGTAPQPLGEGIILVGHNALPFQVHAGDRLLLELYWNAAQTLTNSLTAQLAFTDAKGNPTVGATFEPVPGYDTSLWQAGDTWRGIHLLRVPPALSGAYTVSLELQGGAQAVLGEIMVAAPQRVYQAPAVSASTAAAFGELAELIGYDASVAVQAGQPFSITLHWRALGETERGYKVFVHLLDAEGRSAAGHDAEPANWQRPTTSWVAGEYIADEHVLALPADLPAGSYRIEVGIYDGASGERLPLADGSDRLILSQPVEVTAPPQE